MLIKIILGVLLLWYALFNIYVMCVYTPKAMCREMWVEQSIVGKISVNIFCAPAWMLQALYVGVFIGFYWIVKGIAIGTLWVVHKMHNGYTKALRGE